MDTILKTTNLTKKFGQKFAVNAVNVTINRGDIYGFIGKNGAGKTTFMRMVLNMANPTSGELSLFNGEDRTTCGKKIGSLIEAPGLYNGCSAFENMKRFAILTGDSDETINELLSFVGLSEVGHKKAGKFSLGMKQRLGIAIAMLGNPEFMVLDEPVNGLDPAGIKEIRDIILKLNKEKNTTFLISSHLLDELSKVVTKYGIINNGVLIEEISAEELNKSCRHRLRISVDQVDKAYEILKETIPENEMMKSESALFLFSHLDEGAKINQLLSKNDLLVSSLELQSEGLEQYFIERIGK